MRFSGGGGKGENMQLRSIFSHQKSEIKKEGCLFLNLFYYRHSYYQTSNRSQQI